MAAIPNGTTEYGIAVNSSVQNGSLDDHVKVSQDLAHLLDNIDRNLKQNALGTYSPAFATMYKERMATGIRALIGDIYKPNNPAWDDAMSYALEVIIAPKDSAERASSQWVRSSSELNRALLKRFSPGTIDAAKLGTASIIDNFYGGDRLAIAHVDKKASFMRHRDDAKSAAGYYPKSSILAAICYQTAAFPCALAMSWFLSAEEAVQAAYISHLSVCDDLGSIAAKDYDTRMRLVAIAAGVAYKYGGRALNVFVDGTTKQAMGTATEEPRSIEAAMAWRAVGGCSTIYSKFNFDEECDLDTSLVAPLVMMATHDLLDWRCDMAAGNHENALSAVHGFGIEQPFHAFLEAMLHEALSHPQSGIYGIAAVVSMHFIAGRYGCWEYRGTHKPACDECVRLLRKGTEEAGLEWLPKPPPKSYAEGDEVRESGKQWSDHFTDQSIIQEALGWFQYLVSTGEIWLFDVMAEGAQAVDAGADWE
ncbi:hypothetical protein F4777DRAFT_292354 [Nemania sp. FL0916]|nr:hypothetical protein F4777DRAFT_292354 [Nemania sp. FL0916]